MDARFPSAQNGPGADIPSDYAGALSHLLFMIENIPEHLLTLRNSALAEFGEAVGELRNTLAVWHVGVRTETLHALPGKNGWNPLAFIRKHIVTLPDEGPDLSTDHLDFLIDGDLKTNLATDLVSLAEELDRGAWKASTILAGSVTEALLLAALLVDEQGAREAAKTVSPVPGPDLPDWTLHQLTEVAEAVGLLTDQTASQCRIARNFRNLIHPGRTLRLTQTCNRGTAYAARAAVELVISDLAKKKR